MSALAEALATSVGENSGEDVIRCWKIEVRCSERLMQKYASLREALSGHPKYYIEVVESENYKDNETADGQFTLSLKKWAGDNSNTHPSPPELPSSPEPVSELAFPVSETTNSNEVLITTTGDLSKDNHNMASQRTGANQQFGSDQYISIQNCSDILYSTKVSGSLLNTQDQKSSATKTISYLENPTQFLDSQVPAECKENYDEKFAYDFNQYLMEVLNFCHCYKKKHYIQCIKEHFKAKKCPSGRCLELWTYCIKRKFYSALKYSSEGLLIHSKHQTGKIGTICQEYFSYQERIGSGGCGEVYKFNLQLKAEEHVQLALKEEKKRPMILNVKVFEQMKELNSRHVIKMLEYVVGPLKKDGSHLFLFVMPYMNKGGLDVQFKNKKLTCVLDYISQSKQQKLRQHIIRNYIVICLHLLRGLQYLQNHGLVHRDIKVSNILVQQNCGCVSPLQCICGGDGGVQYVLGDLNLMCMEDDQSGKGGEWEKMLQHAPAGTIGKIAPELFFKTNRGERFGSHKSDVYSACVTMMDILVGNELDASSHAPIAEFFGALSTSYQALFANINNASRILDKTLAKIQGTAEVIKIKQLLNDSQSYVHQMQAFQGSYVSEIYSEKSPLARILTTVYRANSLHWPCLNKLPDIHHTNLWTKIEAALDVIAQGVKFMPLNRPDANILIACLENVHPRPLLKKSKSKDEHDADDIQTEYLIED